MKTVPDDWRKSSRSSTNTNCVEVYRKRTAIRDSKNPSGPTLVVDLSGMFAAVKAGSLDR